VLDGVEQHGNVLFVAARERAGGSVAAGAWHAATQEMVDSIELQFGKQF
jgi:hypothetical protein